MYSFNYFHFLRAYAWRISYFKKSHSPAEAHQVLFKCEIFTRAYFLALVSQHPPFSLLQHPGSDDSLHVFFFFFGISFYLFLVAENFDLMLTLHSAPFPFTI